MYSEREARIANVAQWYADKCESYCKELISRQREWRNELRSHVPGLKATHSSGVQGRLQAGKKEGPREEKDELAEGGTEHSPSGVQLSKEPIRQQLVWQGNEREALRKSLLMFGIGRSERVRTSMKSLLKSPLRHGVGDVADASCHFLRQVGCQEHTDSRARPWAERKLADLAREGTADLSDEVAQRVGTWDKLDVASCVRAWSRRLKLLDQLGDVLRMLAVEENLPSAFQAVDSLKDATVPGVAWWSRDADFAILSGVFRHGYGNYEEVRDDPQFSNAFGPCGGRGAGENSRASAEEGSGASTGWPDAYTLTRRLKRLLDHLHKLTRKGPDFHRKRGFSSKAEAEAENLPPVPSSLSSLAPRRSSSSSQTWLKREKLEFVRVLTTWGAMASPSGSHPLWRSLREKSNLPGFTAKSDVALDMGLAALLAEAQALMSAMSAAQRDKAAKSKIVNHPSSCGCIVCKYRRKGLALQKRLTETATAGGPPLDGADATLKQLGPAVLTAATAVRLTERCDLMEVLRWAVANYRGSSHDWSGVGICLFRSHELPHWWSPGPHDRALARAVLKHGFGQWEAILSDPSFPFHEHQSEPLQVDQSQPSVAQELDPMGFGTEEGDWAEEEKEEEEEAEAEERGGVKEDKTADVTAGEGVPGAGAPLAGHPYGLLPPKILIRRLKYVEKILRRQMFKQQKKGMKRRRSDGSDPLSPPPPSDENLPANDDAANVHTSIATSAPPSTPTLDSDPTANLDPNPDPDPNPNPNPNASPSPSPNPRRLPDTPIPKKYKYTKAVAVLRDESGKPVLPLALTDRMHVLSLGSIVVGRPGWHTERHIFPADFTSQREHASMAAPATRTRYTCSIVDLSRGSGGPPTFRIVPQDAPHLTVERDSASGAWVAVCTAVNRLRGVERDKVAINGTEMFGLSHPVVCRLIQELPNAHKCTNFRPELSFSRFERPVDAKKKAARAEASGKTVGSGVALEKPAVLGLPSQSQPSSGHARWESVNEAAPTRVPEMQGNVLGGIIPNSYVGASAMEGSAGAFKSEAEEYGGDAETEEEGEEEEEEEEENEDEGHAYAYNEVDADEGRVEAPERWEYGVERPLKGVLDLNVTAAPVGIEGMHGFVDLNEPSGVNNEVLRGGIDLNVDADEFQSDGSSEEAPNQVERLGTWQHGAVMGAHDPGLHQDGYASDDIADEQDGHSEEHGDDD